jgi:hypothetical protein
MEEILSSIRRIVADEEADEAGDETKLAPSQDAKRSPAENGLTTEAPEDDESEDVLELTKVVRDSGEVVDLKTESAVSASEDIAVAAAEEAVVDAAEEAAFSAVAEEVKVEQPEPPAAELDEIELAPLEDQADEVGAETQGQALHAIEEDKSVVETKHAGAEELVSTGAATTAIGAFSKVSKAFQPTPPEASIADGSGRTVEQFIEDMIRPMLKDWLDRNMPPMVEKLVQQELQKIARRAELL